MESKVSPLYGFAFCYDDNNKRLSKKLSEYMKNDFHIRVVDYKNKCYKNPRRSYRLLSSQQLKQYECMSSADLKGVGEVLAY